LTLIASATATLLFRQFFLSVPDELVEAAKIDGATTIVIGIRQMIGNGIRQMIGNGDAQTAWHLVMATALLAMLPVAVVLAMQRWFVAGLVETEK
jgi:sn-glycerol 3-phosphate transport system permease protein